MTAEMVYDAEDQVIAQQVIISRLTHRLAALVVVVLLLSSTGVFGTYVMFQQSNEIGTLQRSQVNGRASRVEFQAVVMFVTCAKSDSAVRPDRLGEFREACGDYDSLEHARAAEARKSPKAVK